jgi:RNA polymerase sigma factor (sigma-70 family)
MNSNHLRAVLRRLHDVTAPQEAGGLADGELLARFALRRDEAAFETLVWRHGTMVFNLCRRLLRLEEDAEDAFQATFLVLARKAGSIGKRQAVGAWLYRVAYRVALRARAGAARRAARERQGLEFPPVEPAGDLVWRDLRPVLDEEVGRLPEKYRLPVILCYLAGQTTEEAARRLGCARGTVLSRLAWARQRLRTRLARRGLGVSCAALASLLSLNGISAALPGRLVGVTVVAARWFAAGPAVVAGVLSPRAMSLTEGVLRAMFLTKVKAVSTVLALVALGACVALWASRPATAEANGGRKDEPSRSASRAVDEPTPPPRAKGLLGDWERHVGPCHITLHVEADRLHGTFTEQGKGETLTVAIDADYSTNKEGLLYGVVTGVELPGDGEEEADATVEFVDQPFSVRVRIDDNVLTVKDLKFMGGPKDKGDKDILLLQGRYKRKSAGREDGR